MLYLPIPETIRRVIVHQPRRLHKRVANRRADELETARFQIRAQRVRFFARRGNLLDRFEFVDARLAADK